MAMDLYAAYTCGGHPLYRVKDDGDITDSDGRCLYMIRNEIIYDMALTPHYIINGDTIQDFATKQAVYRIEKDGIHEFFTDRIVYEKR